MNQEAARQLLIALSLIVAGVSVTVLMSWWHVRQETRRACRRNLRRIEEMGEHEESMGALGRAVER